MKYFATFASDDEKYQNALERLVKQAHEFEIFTIVRGYTIHDLDDTFWKRHRHFIMRNQKGFGYWIWKPFLILKTLTEMKDDDVLLYTDVGCELHVDFKSDLDRYYDIVEKVPMLCTISQGLEVEYSKKKVLQFLNVDHDEKILYSKQYQAGVIMMRKTPIVVKFVEEWYRTACHYSLIDDNTEVDETHQFKAHRHDQSIFSILYKKYNAFSNVVLYSPIHIVRNFSKNSIFSKS